MKHNSKKADDLDDDDEMLDCSECPDGDFLMFRRADDNLQSLF